MKYILPLIIFSGLFFLASCQGPLESSSVINYAFAIGDTNGNVKTTFAPGEDIRMVFLKENLTGERLALTGPNPDAVFRVYRDTVLMGSSTDNMNYFGTTTDESLNPYHIRETIWYWMDNPVHQHQPLPPGTYYAQISYSTVITNFNLYSTYVTRIEFTVQ